MARAAIFGACLLLVPSLLHAQPAAADDPPVDQNRRQHERRVYVAMWTTHLKDDVLVLDNNWVVGVTAGGWFGATFHNSFGRRAFAAGLQRLLISSEQPRVTTAIGYRLGAVSGYDGRLMRLARKTPVMPLVQPFVSFDVARVGVEVSYTFVVVSGAVSFRF